MPSSLAHGGAETNQEHPAQYLVEEIQGGFLPISTMQICLAWWLYREKHITLRQLRVFFALHEMKTRRKHTKSAERGGTPRKAFYQVKELSKLVGGQGTDSALRDLKSDVKKLEKLGLAAATSNTISFAISPDQINVADLTDFWEFWKLIPNKRRAVPIPRRTLRAIAAGFKKSTMGVMLALLIRSVHWHKREGDFRVDGRTKASWISEVFGLSQRAVTDGRNQLRALGWCVHIPVSQSMLNRYGARDLINVHWSISHCQGTSNDADKPAQPQDQNSGELASPIKNRILLSTKEPLKNRTSTSTANAENVRGSRKKVRRGQAAPPPGPPKLTALDPRHLAETSDLLQLHEQAIAAGLTDDSEMGQLNFFALAERARSRGREPHKLFRWLLTNQKFDFITQADEEAANKRLKDHLYDRNNPMYQRTSSNDNLLDEEEGLVQRQKCELTETDRWIKEFFRIGKLHRVSPFCVAKAKGWSREHYATALADFKERHGALD